MPRVRLRIPTSPATTPGKFVPSKSIPRRNPTLYKRSPLSQLLFRHPSRNPRPRNLPPIRLETRRTSAPPPSRASASKCDALTNKLGQIFDKMDQARRKGYTQKQMDAWNLQVKELERKKQLSGCF